jgi:CRP-like cAMP-binding protein
MLTPSEQRTVFLAPIAVLATATGLLTWTRPEWSFFPLLGLLVLMRPVLLGRMNKMIRVGAELRLSDAEHAFVFPPNRTPRVRWRMLRAHVRDAVTWLEIGYGVLWTLALGYFVGVLTAVPPWTLTFWKTQGPLLGLAIVVSLALLGIVYAGSEFYLFARERAIARRETLRLWWRRWFGRGKRPLEESDRLAAIRRSPLLRQLPPPVQQSLAKAMKPVLVSAWKPLFDFDVPIAHVSLILSGKVGVYRKAATGRRDLVQVLCEHELVGLHAVADPEFPQFSYRTLTPVVLLQVDWDQAATLVLARFGIPTLANLVQKLPFLARISLCQNWHMQAVQRFAELASVANYGPDDVLLQDGFFSESFFVMFEGSARVTRGGRVRGRVRAGDFFGEIGLLQNSNASAQVQATGPARSLCIRRKEFLRFVAHNYAVALELERVSSQRLGRPIFPLSPGNFRPI